jgi:hypothetical protein
MALAEVHRKVAADCARLARIAPSPEARAGFAAAAKSWLMLAGMADEAMPSDDVPALRRASVIADHEPRNAAWME